MSLEPARPSVPPLDSMRRRRELATSDRQWWSYPLGDPGVAQAMFSRYQELRNLQKLQLLEMVRNVVTYHGPNASRLMGSLGLPSILGNNWGAGLGSRAHKIHNVTAWGINTVAALICANKPKATFLTKGGDFEQSTRAKMLTDFCEAMFVQNKAYQLGVDYCFDMLVFPEGINKTYMGPGGRVKYGRVLPPNLTIDEDEASERNPRQFYERHCATREQVCGLFPKKAKEIMNAPSVIMDGTFGMMRRRYPSRNVEMVESFRLPEGDYLRGRHIIAVQNAVLFEEHWDDPDAPYTFFRWEMPRIGFHGIPLAEQLRGVQTSVDMLDAYVAETIRRVSRARIWIPESARISTSQIGNGIASAYRYSGLRPPTIDNSDSVPKEMLTERAEKLQSWQPVAGVGSEAAEGSMPSQLRSAPAQKQHLQFMNARQENPNSNYANGFMDMALKTVKLVRKEFEQKKIKTYVVKLRRGGILQPIDFKDASIPESDVELQVSATNFFADSPEAQMDDTVDLMQNRLLTPMQGLVGMDYPDLRALTDPITAPYRFATYICQELMSGKIVHIEDWMDVQTAIPLVAGALMDLIPKNPKPKIRDAFERFLREAVQVQQTRQAAVQQAALAAAAPLGGAAPGGAPIAAPPAAPRGELQPFKAVKSA